MNLENKHIVVSGGSSGLGLAVVNLCLNKGCKVSILDLEQAKGQKDVCFQKVDVRSENEVRSAIKLVVAKNGPIHINVNCAGVATASKLIGRKGLHTLDLFQKVIDINLVGTFNMIRCCAEQMVKNPESEKGVIINTSSAAATEGQIGQAAYAASKGGINSMTLPLAREMATMGIRVNAIAPGLFHTPLFEGLKPEAIDSLASQVPFPKRLGKPSEFAHLVVSIIENEMINGSVIRLDGALRMNNK